MTIKKILEEIRVVTEQISSQHRLRHENKFRSKIYLNTINQLNYKLSKLVKKYNEAKKLEEEKNNASKHKTETNSELGRTETNDSHTLNNNRQNESQDFRSTGLLPKLDGESGSE